MNITGPATLSDSLKQLRHNSRVRDLKEIKIEVIIKGKRIKSTTSLEIKFLPTKPLPIRSAHALSSSNQFQQKEEEEKRYYYLVYLGGSLGQSSLTVTTSKNSVRKEKSVYYFTTH